VDVPERSRLLDPCYILQGTEDQKRFHRYQAECRSTFHRSYAALLKTMDRDKEEDHGTGRGADGADLRGSEEGKDGASGSDRALVEDIDQKAGPEGESARPESAACADDAGACTSGRAVEGTSQNEVAIWKLSRRGFFNSEQTIPTPAFCRGCVVASVPG